MSPNNSGYMVLLLPSPDFQVTILSFIINVLLSWLVAFQMTGILNCEDGLPFWLSSLSNILLGEGGVSSSVSPLLAAYLFISEFHCDLFALSSATDLSNILITVYITCNLHFQCCVSRHVLSCQIKDTMSMSDGGTIRKKTPPTHVTVYKYTHTHTHIHTSLGQSFAWILASLFSIFLSDFLNCKGSLGFGFFLLFRDLK